MNLKLVRNKPDAGCMLGSLYVDGEFFCTTLEDEPRKKKIKHETAIPSGKYEVIINWSNRFKSYMPLLLNVPYFEGIRIHSGNTEFDSSGCILVGTLNKSNFISNSASTYKKLMTILRAAEKKEKIFIEIVGGFSKDEMTL